MTNTQKPSISIFAWNLEAGMRLANISGAIESVTFENGTAFVRIPFVRQPITFRMVDRVQVHLDRL